MVGTTRLLNKTATEQEVKQHTERHIPDLLTLLAPKKGNLAVSGLVAQEDFYQQLKSVPNTIISLQYNSDEFVTFNIGQAKQGQVVKSGTKATNLCCQIGEKIYTFNHKHFNQMSKRECNELFNHLGIDGSQLLQDQ
jgi:hypothetical protein